jgi:hypothetical protein
LEEPSERGHQSWAGVAQFGAVLSGKPPQRVLTRVCETNTDLPAIFSAANPLDQSSAGQAIHQADGAVMLNQEMARQVPHGWASGLIQSPDRQQHLMLLRLEAFVLGRRLAEMQKPADMVPKSR